MASEDPTNPMTESGVTMHSDSEQYSAGDDISPSPESSGSPALLLYQPPTLFSLIRGAAINLFLPFINGMMLGFGELFAHEAAFRLGWSGTRVSSVAQESPENLEVESGIVGSMQELLTRSLLDTRSSRRLGANDTPSGPVSKSVTNQGYSPASTTLPAWSD